MSVFRASNNGRVTSQLVVHTITDGLMKMVVLNEDEITSLREYFKDEDK